MREEEVNREALICSDVCTVSTKRLLKHLLGPSSIVLPPLVRCENKLLSKPLIIILYQSISHCQRAAPSDYHRSYHYLEFGDFQKKIYSGRFVTCILRNRCKLEARIPTTGVNVVCIQLFILFPQRYHNPLNRQNLRHRFGGTYALG